MIHGSDHAVIPNRTLATPTIAEAILAALGRRQSLPLFLVPVAEGECRTVIGRDFCTRISRYSDLFRRAGIGPKHTALLFLDNSVDYVAIFLALGLRGAIPVLAKTDFRQLELDEIFQSAHPHAVFTEDRYLPILKPYVADRTVIVRQSGGLDLRQCPVAPRTEAELPEGTASINFTYRGHGFPLGALVSHEQYLRGVEVFRAGLQPEVGETILALLPMCHIFTLVGGLLDPLLHGMRVLLADQMHPRVLFDLIREFRVEYTLCTPEIYAMLSRADPPADSIRSLRALVCGGSQLGADEHRRIEGALGVQLLHGYGLTEMAPVSCHLRGQSRPGTVGPPGLGVECRIDSPDRNGDGEILVRTAGLSSGYIGRPRETSLAWDQDWFHTGDLGHLDDDHLVFARERKATCKVHGNLVDLQEVERALQLVLPGQRTEVSLEEGQLTARLSRPRAQADRQALSDLRTALRGLIAGYKIPRRFIVR